MTRGSSASVRAVLTVALLAATACGNAESGAEPDEVVVETRGDTTIVTNPATAPRVDTISEIRTVWRNDALANPSVLAKSDELLVVGDRTRLHLVTTDGTARTVGQAGEGPGEFGWIAQVALRGDSIVVLDGRLLRHTIYALDGTFLDDHAVTWPTPYVNPPRDGAAVALRGDSIVRIATENVWTTRPQREALLVQPLSGGEARVHREWDEREWIELDRSGLGAAMLFGPEGHSAVSVDGRLAVGDGLEYCISLEAFGTSAVRRVCRDWDRQPVGSGVRGASVSQLPDDLLPERVDVIRASFEEQTMGDHHPSYDALAFGMDGALWVRTIGPDVPDIHPTVLNYRPDLRPSHHSWDRFDPDGRLTHTIALPTDFTPRVFDTDGAWGFLTLETGEVVLAHAALPD